jgi:hypothetical protein
MNTENTKSDRGAVLLGELKALVDSFSEHQRKEVIKIIGSIVTGLNARCQNRHSADPFRETESNSPTRAPQAPGTSDLNE